MLASHMLASNMLVACLLACVLSPGVSQNSTTAPATQPGTLVPTVTLELHMASGVGSTLAEYTVTRRTQLRARLAAFYGLEQAQIRVQYTDLGGPAPTTTTPPPASAAGNGGGDRDRGRGRRLANGDGVRITVTLLPPNAFAAQAAINESSLDALKSSVFANVAGLEQARPVLALRQMCNASNATATNPTGSGCVEYTPAGDANALATFATLGLLVPMSATFVSILGPKRLRSLLLGNKDGKDRS